MSQLKTDEDSLDWSRRGKKVRGEKKQGSLSGSFTSLQGSELNRPSPPWSAHTAVVKCSRRSRRSALSYRRPFHLLFHKEELTDRGHCDL